MTDREATPSGQPDEVAGAPAPATGPAAGRGPDAGAAGNAAGPAGGAGGIDDVVEADVLDGEPAGDSAPGGQRAGDPLAVVTAERDEYLDSLRRLQAEFENYRKRVAKQQVEQSERAALSLVDKLLPVLDALDLAEAHLGDPQSDDARALVAASGLLNDVLAKEGLERVDPEGEGFDPTAHEAVGHVPADEGDGEVTDGPVVAQVMRAGYRWRGAVVRPAMVTVRG